jgi:hypothetical protein
MPPDHNQQHPRRPHYHRGRRGPDRRGGERRPQQSQTETASREQREQVDIEQIMREIRSRISERHGIDLTNQQIQELAARRLEAILDPRTIKPSLMDELRRAAGVPSDAPPAEFQAEDILQESSLYESGNGLLRAIRRLLNPLLKLFFNPASIVDALNAQARRAKAVETRDAEQRRRQAEWNALHFEILRRLVTDTARVEIDNQHLAHRVESLAARVDFSERRVRTLEQLVYQLRPAGRAPEPAIVAAPPTAPREEATATEHVANDVSPDGGRRRRRRRRGRRSGQPRDVVGAPVPGLAEVPPTDSSESDDFNDEDAGSEDLAEDVVLASPGEDQPIAELPPAPSPVEEQLPVGPPQRSVQSTELESSAPSVGPVEPSDTADNQPEPAAVADNVDRRDSFPPDQS